MTIRACRIVKHKHRATAFSGDGAKQNGGRWTTPGLPAVYVAGSAALAMLEMLVHLETDDLLNEYVLFNVTFDDSLVTALDPATLPQNWRQSPPPPAIQQIGNLWIARAKSAILTVPSAIVPTESNFILNPTHSDFARIKIDPPTRIQFDPRFIKTLRP